MACKNYPPKIWPLTVIGFFNFDCGQIYKSEFFSQTFSQSAVSTNFLHFLIYQYGSLFINFFPSTKTFLSKVKRVSLIPTITPRLSFLTKIKESFHADFVERVRRENICMQFMWTFFVVAYETILCDKFYALLFYFETLLNSLGFFYFSFFYQIFCPKRNKIVWIIFFIICVTHYFNNNKKIGIFLALLSFFFHRLIK